MSTAKAALTLYEDPIAAANTAQSDFRIADLMNAEHPVSLYLVVPRRISTAPARSSGKR